MPPKLLIAGILALAAIASMSPEAAAQPYPWDARFGWICIAPREDGPWYVPFTGIGVDIEAEPESVLATFPTTWQGRNRIDVRMDVREPGMVITIQPPLSAYANVQGEVFFEPPLPSQAPVDSLIATWPPLALHESLGESYCSNECTFHIGCGPAVATAEATINLVGFYASGVDTVKVWGTEFGWPDLHLFAEENTIYAPSKKQHGVASRLNFSTAAAESSVYSAPTSPRAGRGQRTTTSGCVTADAPAVSRH